MKNNSPRRTKLNTKGLNALNFKLLFYALRFKFCARFGVNRQRGIALLELLVAMSIFTITISIVVAVFIAMVSSERRSANAVDIDNTASSVLESIAKEMRTGKEFSFISGCGWSDINSYCNAITFVNYRGQIVIYNLNGAQYIEKECAVDTNANGVIDVADNDCYTGGSPTIRTITPSTVKIADLRFNMDGQNPNATPDNKQSKITVTLRAETPSSVPLPAKREIILQTTVSSREPDS